MIRRRSIKPEGQSRELGARLHQQIPACKVHDNGAEGKKVYPLRGSSLPNFRPLCPGAYRPRAVPLYMAPSQCDEAAPNCQPICDSGNPPNIVNIAVCDVKSDVSFALWPAFQPFPPESFLEKPLGPFSICHFIHLPNIDSRIAPAAAIYHRILFRPIKIIA